MQAAGGTALDDDARPRVPLRRVRLVFAISAVAAYAADVLTKVWAAASLGERDVPLVGDLLVLHLVRNPGAAFSTGTQFTVGLSLLAIVAALVALTFGLRARTTGWGLALGLLLAGVCGNLTDRLLRAPGPLRGHVVDFLMLPHWPVFNLADVFIDTAAVLILVQVLRGVRLDGQRAS